jgi:hypothetical protein
LAHGDLRQLDRAMAEIDPVPLDLVARWLRSSDDDDPVLRRGALDD